MYGQSNNIWNTSYKTAEYYSVLLCTCTPVHTSVHTFKISTGMCQPELNAHNPDWVVHQWKEDRFKWRSPTNDSKYLNDVIAVIPSSLLVLSLARSVGKSFNSIFIFIFHFHVQSESRSIDWVFFSYFFCHYTQVVILKFKPKGPPNLSGFFQSISHSAQGQIYPVIHSIFRSCTSMS